MLNSPVKKKQINQNAMGASVNHMPSTGHVETPVAFHAGTGFLQFFRLFVSRPPPSIFREAHAPTVLNRRNPPKSAHLNIHLLLSTLFTFEIQNSGPHVIIRVCPHISCHVTASPTVWDLTLHFLQTTVSDSTGRVVSGRLITMTRASYRIDLMASLRPSE